MADHFVSINRGVDGFKYADFTTGTSTTAGADIELRVRDGAGLRKIDVVKALDAFERFVNNAQQMKAAGIDASG